MAQLAFDASGVEPAAPLELLPPGKYVAQIVQSEMQPTKLGDGQMLCLELDILEGPHRGRKLWDRLNLVNRSQQTMEIAQRTLSAICHAVGQIQVSDSEQLHFRPMLVSVNVEYDNRDERLPAEERRRQNKVKGYAATGGARPAAAAPAQVATAQAARPGPTAPRPASAPPSTAPSTVPSTAPWRRTA